VTGDPDFNSEKTLGEIDQVLLALEGGYGLNRNESIQCLEWMACCLEDFRPGDPGLEASFHLTVVDCANDFQPWAEKVHRAITERKG
jgi:hypothetical protein